MDSNYQLLPENLEEYLNQISQLDDLLVTEFNDVVVQAEEIYMQALEDLGDNGKTSYIAGLSTESKQSQEFLEFLSSGDLQQC